MERLNELHRLGINVIKNAIKKAKLDFNYKIDENDKIIAIDKETPFIVLIKSHRRFLWAIDFLLGEHVENYNKIPKIRVSDYLKVSRGM